MRRFEKKKIIQECNLRLENERLFEKMNLNEIGDEPFPYEYTQSYNDLSYAIEFKVPKEDKAKMGDDSVEESFYDMEAKYSMYHTPTTRNHPNITKLAKELGYEGEELPDNLFAIYISFGVLNQHKSLDFPELKSKYVFRTMATVQAAALEIIKKNISFGKTLFMVFSYPMGGGKGGDLREKLYNLYYDMQINKKTENNLFANFKKWSISPYAGVVNIEVINGNLIPPKPIFRSNFSLAIGEFNKELFDAFVDYYETTIKGSDLTSNFEIRNPSIKYLDTLIKHVTVEQVKDIFIDFKTKKGIELTKENGAHMYFNDKKINNIDDLDNLDNL